MKVCEGKGVSLGGRCASLPARQSLSASIADGIHGMSAPPPFSFGLGHYRWDVGFSESTSMDSLSSISIGTVKVSGVMS